MKRAEAYAQRLLQQFLIDGPPIDVIRIAEDLGINVVFQPLDREVSGVLVVKDGRATMGVNVSHYPNRQRFTIAHEIGHFMLHKPKSGVFVDTTYTYYRDPTASDGSILEEIQANAFAAELLMPENFIKEYLEVCFFDLHDPDAVQEMTNLFEVSEQALAVRLVNLGLFRA